MPLTAGPKGSVMLTNTDWAFVLVKFTDEAKAEITADGFVPIDMMVHRKINGVDTIVTRIRVTTPPDKNNVSIADIVYGWDQIPIQVGDTVVPL